MRLIDADALIEKCGGWYVEEGTESGFIGTLKNLLATEPTIQPERKKGEWIEISSINHTYKCSECGRLLINVADGRNNVSKHYPYCHCGADMRGERQK